MMNIVLSAARGQTGSTARLLSAMARQEIINFAGEDMTLDAVGGEYGRQYTAQQGALDLAIMAMGQRQKDLEVEKMNKESDLEMQQLALQDYQAAQMDYLTSIGETLGSAIELGHVSGQSYDQLAAKVDEYRQYIDVSDEDYITLKKNLLKNYEPIDFEIRQNSVTYDISDENSHITDYFYEIYDKATGKLATEDQIDTLLRTYASNVKESQLYTNVGDWTDSKRVLSNKAINAIRKNSNYDARKDFT